LHTLKREQWHKEQIVSILYNNVTGSIVGSVANIVIVSCVLVNIYPTVGLLIWLLAGLSLNAFRAYIHHLYVEDITRFEVHIWLQLHRVLTLLSGCIYGALALFFFSSEQPLYQMLIILLPGGMGAAAVGTHSVDRITFQSFLLSAVAPLVLRCLFEETPIHSIIAAMLCILMLIMLKSAEQTKKIMIDNIYLSQSLRYRATHDGLVDLLNRDEFENEFDRMVSATAVSSSNSDPVVTSMIFIDLDNFKILNDTYGHQAGDSALIKVGEIIRSAIRKSDIAARFGGDEFMILIQSNSVDQANNVAEKIQVKIKQFQESMKEMDKSFGASVGIGYSENTIIKFEDLLSVADKACYKAKRSGKNKINQVKLDV